MTPRYEVCTIDGYNIGVETRRAQTLHWIADSWYGFREVARSAPSKNVHPITARLRAEDRCAELNTEHDAWMRDNGYASPVYSSVEGGDK